jgi:alkylation response protein AidB-like acyl-CoA dehydrogenase
VEAFSVEDRQAMCDTFSRLLQDMADEPKLRQLLITESGFDQSVWEKMSQLGLMGILIGPEHGGVGGSLVEVEALMEHAGAYLYGGPFISTCVIAPTILSACSDESLAEECLRAITEGSAIFSVAGCGSSGAWDLPPEVQAVFVDQSWLLTGTADFVSYAAVANQCLVYANVDGGKGVFLVDMNENGIALTPHNTDDATIRLSSMSLDAVVARQVAGVGEEVMEEALQVALVALAGEQVGAARRIFEITIEYLKTRHQFGQPIGSFQALKHIAADLLIELESASSAAQHAARAIAAGSDDRKLMSCLAGFTCADNYRKITADAIQLHGGIAYTMEHPAHLFWRRAQTGQWLYCSSDTLRDNYLAEMEKML